MSLALNEMGYKRRLSSSDGTINCQHLKPDQLTPEQHSRIAERLTGIAQQPQPQLRGGAAAAAAATAVAAPLRSLKAFLIFIGYSRSGHTLLGALLDGHPNVGPAIDPHLTSRCPIPPCSRDTTCVAGLADDRLERG
jgi:hypothetical protein